MANMCVLFAIASLLVLVDAPQIAIVVTSLAIGSMNSIFERSGEVSIPLTYMTGTLVKMGQRFVDAFFGGSHAAWLDHLRMWSGLTAGAVFGALSYHYVGLTSIPIASALTLVITLVAVIHRMYGRRHGSQVRITTEPHAG